MDKMGSVEVCLLQKSGKKCLQTFIYKIPEDILHARREQTLIQIEGLSMERNSLSLKRGILKQKYFSRFACKSAPFFSFFKKELRHIIFKI